MKNSVWMLFVGLALMTATLAAPASGAAAPKGSSARQAAWSEVEKAINEGLPQTAIDKLGPIIEQAIADGALAEATRGICRRIVLEGNIQGNKPEEKIVRLEREIASAAVEVRPLMTLVLARWYWHFFQQNQWRFMNRTATAQLNETDILTWDLPKIFGKIDALYLEALKSADQLKAIETESLRDFLQPGSEPGHLRPTLYDFAVHEALVFYCSGEQAAAKPADAFEVRADSPALGPIAEFLAWKVETTDDTSPKVRAIKLLQQIIAWHRGEKRREPVLDLELFRLHWARQVAVGETASVRYLEQLEKLADADADLPLSSMVLAEIAREHFARGRRTKAHEVATVGAKRFPNSVGGLHCRQVISQIEAKSLELHCERVLARPWPKIKLQYTNLDQVHFRVVPDEWRKLLGKECSNPEQAGHDHWRRLVNRTAVRSWRQALEPTTDYQPKQAEAALEDLEPGFYWVLASWKPDFSESENQVHIAPIWVSTLGLVSRSRDGRLEGLVTHLETGEPIPNARVISWYHRWDQGVRKSGETTTDANGVYRIDPSPKHEGHLIEVQALGQTLLDHSEWYAGERGSRHSRVQAFIFTDRSIYRPGQTINYKVLLVRVDQEGDKYQTVANVGCDISFRDVNGQEIRRESKVSNDFGSLSGTFTAPTDRLTGQMSLNVDSFDGHAAVRVEEYKRPKFKASLEAPADGGKLGLPVTVKGEAMGYNGAPVDGALVKYRITRRVRMPWWWCWWGGNPNQESQEIDHGTLRTDADGRFAVTFTARPDLSVPEKDDPSFEFEVSADVTDSAGETRSAATSIRVGYTALELRINSARWLPVKEPVKLQLNTATLDGKGVPAKGTLLVYRLKAPAEVVRANLAPPWGNRQPGPAEPATWETDQVAAEAEFQTQPGGSAEVEVKLPAGAFRVVARSTDRYGKEVTARYDLTVIDPSASVWPVKQPNFVVVEKPSLEPGETFRLLWGTGYGEGRAFIEVEHRRKLLKSFWTPAGRTQGLVELGVTEAMRGGFTVRVTQVREGRCYLHSTAVQVPWSNKRLTLGFSHFTSKLLPGAKETWKVSIKGPQAELVAAEMVAAAYDASLDAFCPHAWPGDLGIFRTDDSHVDQRFANLIRPMNCLWSNWYSIEHAPGRTYWSFPHDIVFNFYGYGYARMKSRRADFADACDEGMVMPSCAAAPSMEMESRSAGLSMQSANVVSMDEMKGESKEKSLGGGSAGGDSAPKPAQAGPDLDQVAARANLNETAFFFPHLLTDPQGNVELEFTMPEALTTWNVFGFAHTREAQTGLLVGKTITQKDLMVQPNPPRFLREGDQLAFTAKLTNLTDQPLSGKVRFTLTDPATGKARSADFGVQQTEQPFELGAKASKSVAWTLTVPDGAGVLSYKVVAAAANVSDGEEGYLPVLSRRILVHEALPLPIRGPAKKQFSFKKLMDSGKSDTLRHQAITVQVTSNPAWYAVQALPYLIEFPHECSEQIFNRLYANSLARHIARSDPKIRKVFDTWRQEEAQGGKALLSNLERNEDLKSVLLLETPWVREAKNETEAKHRVGLLFEENRLDAELKRAANKLAQMQLGDGSWPWFPGGRGDSYITLYVVTGFGRLRHLGVKLDQAPAVRALAHLDGWITEIYENLKRHGHLDRNNLSSLIALFLYGRSFYLDDRPLGGGAKVAVDYFIDQGRKHWLSLDCRQSQGHLALGMFRLGERETPKKIMASIKERSVTDEELGRFWRDTEHSWWWYRAPIETQAVMIEAFAEVAKDETAVEECKVWLLKQKQTQDWKTSKATADAIYALLLRGANLLASDRLVRVSLAGQEVKPEKVEAGTGFYEKRFAAPEIKPDLGRIEMTKEDQGVAWGAVHWQYLEDMAKVTPAETNLKLKKTLFVKRDTKRGRELSPVSGPLQVGDLLTVRIELRVDRDMEYVHLKDQRGAGCEPVNVLSSYRYQDGLAYYEATKDTASHFYIEYLPKGTYVFEYDIRVQHRGKYQTGIAEIQCMYAPEFCSHSQSFVLDVN